MRDHNKNIINKDYRKSETTFVNKDAGQDIVDKGMISSDISAFVGGGAGKEIKEAFKDKPFIWMALKKAGLTYVNQIPRDKAALTNIKGIAEKSATYILENL